ncbi:hypothetical protein RFI_28595 [Reticulomyxa filosa]|uniref:Uncharacterized protein n=1 Tax=Reticulomyxa filosa TaxID=46433 RepID=X6M5P6_RETFI|nr:hypothetical protein RFI_28595 [Reticulomyxa filosa]|eukprot:ETO08792.1 hypothetical protein RFI_28595 [Reticulomyxa filosa]
MMTNKKKSVFFFKDMISEYETYYYYYFFFAIVPFENFVKWGLVQTIQSKCSFISNDLIIFVIVSFVSFLSDAVIRIWDIEITKQLNVFKGHDSYVNSIKYGSNELLNTILSASDDYSVQEIYVTEENEEMICHKFTSLKMEKINREKQMIVMVLIYIMVQLVVFGDEHI